MDAAARVTALLARAEADGSNVIAIDAVRRALQNRRVPVAEPTVHCEFAARDHVLVVGNGRWLMRHPDNCSGYCRVGAAASNPDVREWPDGEYLVWYRGGQLRAILQGGRP